MLGRTHVSVLLQDLPTRRWMLGFEVDVGRTSKREGDQCHVESKRLHGPMVL